MSSQKASQSSSRKRKHDDSFSQPSTSSRKRCLVVEDSDDEEPSTSSGHHSSKQPRLSQQPRMSQQRLTSFFNASQSQTQSGDHENKLAGRIEKIQMINFMCHSNLEIKFNGRINFITGRNGSGKSAVMTALIVVLGGTATLTGRGQGIGDFIKKGENSGKVSITLLNEGLNAYKPDTYGTRITISRQFTKTSNSYSVKSGFGHLVCKKKQEVENIIRCFNLQIKNPICILNQDVSRTFLGATDPGLRFTMFMKATQLEDLKDSYAATYGLLCDTQSSLNEKLGTLEEADKEVKGLKHKLELFMALEKDCKEKQSLENELIWSLVCIEERKLDELNKRKEEINQRIEEMENNEASYDDVIRSIQTQVREHEQKLSEFTDTKNEKRNSKAEYHRESQRINKDVDNVETEIRQLKSKISRELSQINEIREHMAQSEDNSNQSQMEKESATETINEIKDELSVLNDRMATAQRDVNNAQATIDEAQADIENHKFELRDLDNRKRHVEVRLNNANLSQSNQKSANLAKFGPFMPKLIEAIDASDRRNMFQVKPIGPCGLYVSLKREGRPWARSVESVIAGLMPTFCCDNQNDFNVLSKIVERVCVNQRQPNIIISKFTSRHNISSKKVTERPSIIDQLDVKNDVVFNTLIDQSASEAIGLFESEQQACHFLSHTQNVPRNLYMGVTTKGTQYYPAPNYRSYYTSDGHLRYFDEPVKSKEEIRGIEEDLHEIEQEIAQKNKQISDLKLKIHEMRDFINRKDGHLKELRQNKRKLEENLNELKDIEESRPTIHTRVALEEELQMHERIHQSASEKLAERTAKLQDLKAEGQIWTDKLKEASDEEKQINAEMAAVEEKLEEVKFGLNRERRKKQGAGNQLEEAKKELDKIKKCIADKEEAREEKLKTALESCPERVETDRAPADIEKALTKCKKKIAQAEKLTGDRDETIEEYKTKYEAFKKIKRSMRKMEKSIATLERKTKEKHARFERLQDYNANMISFLFQASLQTRGYDGTLNIDFQAKTLDLEVKPRDESVARKDSKTLSGGERSYSTVSFILAIWKRVHMPFYFLDEFDVFMDKLNRKIIMDLLLDHCKSTNNMQFVFITPLDISSIQASEIITIYKMPDPERRNM